MNLYINVRSRDGTVFVCSGVTHAYNNNINNNNGRNDSF